MTARRTHGSITPINTEPSIFDVLNIQVPEWHIDALCAQADPEAWFPEKGGSTRPAKDICRRCPVQAECVDDALSREERFGIWGGLSERERRRINKRTAVPVNHNARKTSCAKGHPFDEDNTYERPGGARECRTCQAASAARYKTRQEEEARPA